MSCDKNPSIEGFDQEIWKSDRKGCNSKREEMVIHLKNNKDKLLGIADTELISLLGKPDTHFYFERGKKSYGYFFEKGNQCETGSVKARSIVFEANAVGRITLITEEVN